MSEYAEYIKMVFKHQFLYEDQVKKTEELDRQDQIEQEKFIVSLGR